MSDSRKAASHGECPDPTGRRDFIIKTALVGASLSLASVPGTASQQQEASTSRTPRLSGRRKLGSLEVSSVGMGVQNMSASTRRPCRIVRR